MSAAGKAAYVYVLECADASLYTGWTHDLAKRLAAHANGTASKYTRPRLPVQLYAWLRFESGPAARSVEARFKQLTRPEKLAAIEARQAFGTPVHKAPLHQEPPGGTMPSRTAPIGEELRDSIEEAKTSQARLATNKGDIVFTFYPDDAPQHSAAFIKIASDGFYDGLKSHRVEPGFVVQGGDPDGNGTGGPGYTLKAEFSGRAHVRGTVAMARAGHPDSAGSQFYICLGDARFLDNQYTVFGQMTDGFDALDAIRAGDTMTKVTIEPKTS
ncbi:MAG: peptidylprolyl isomerase [Candidatus Baltobacteraceae bacterium]